MPADLNRVFFANSGSEAVDTAMKMALAYHRASGEPSRQRFVSRELAYHGVNFGGVSVGGMPRNREGYGPLLPGVVHMRHTHVEKHSFPRGQPEAGADLTDDLQRAVGFYGANTIAAVIVEPVVGSVGILPPPKGYLQRLRRIAAEGAIEFFHGYTYSAHPVATAAGLAALDVYKNEGLFERAKELAGPFQEAVFALQSLPVVEDIRGFGLLAGIDLATDGTLGKRGFAALKALFEAGLLARVTNDTVILAPPFVASPQQIEQMVDIVRTVVKRF